MTVEKYCPNCDTPIPPKEYSKLKNKYGFRYVRNRQGKKVGLECLSCLTLIHIL